jgi:hypothetical protein
MINLSQNAYTACNFILKSQIMAPFVLFIKQLLRTKELHVILLDNTLLMHSSELVSKI